MRVLFVSFIADAPWTGMGHWTYAVKSALERKGFSVDTWFADQFRATRALGRFAILVFPVVLAAQLIVQRRQYDVVVLHEPCGFWYGLARHILPGLPPMVAMCHNVERHHYETMLRYARMGFARVEPLTRLRSPLLRHWQSNGTIRFADHVICLSSVDRAYLINTLHIPEAKVTHVVNGVSVEALADGMPSLGGRRVIWVGGWLDVKGRRLLPDLWHRVRQHLPDATLTLIGTGVDAATVLPAFHERDRASITVIPRVEHPERMRELYRSGSAYLLSSLSEGSPLSLLEAMAAGLPVVATRAGGVPDVATDHLHGLLFAPEEPDAGAGALRRVLEDRALAGQLAAAGQDRVRRLTWDRTADGIAQALTAARSSGR